MKLKEMNAALQRLRDKYAVKADGEIVAADAVAATPLREGAELNMFRIVAGG